VTTNLTNYGQLSNKSLTNGTGGIFFWDGTGTNLLGGFDTNGNAGFFTTNNSGGFISSGSNYWAKSWSTSTNQNQIVPDFSLPEQLMSTNAAFTFLAPVGVQAGKTVAQWTLVMVTNTTAAAILVTAPANCHAVGTMYITNLTAFWFQCYAQKFTNCYATPVF
jgi:hypothetical protein